LNKNKLEAIIPQRNIRKTISIQAMLLFLVLFTALFALMVGRLDISAFDVLKIIASRFFPVDQTWSASIDCVIMDVRLPRIIAGLIVGAGLSVSGVAFQGVFRNPLVSPHLLGVAAGAGFGAALAILLSDNTYLIQVSSFVFGIISVALTYMISRVYRTTPLLMLVLSGIVVGALFSSLTSLAKYIADPMDKMPAIVFWLLGSLNHVSNKDLLTIMPVFIAGISVIYLVRWRINLLSLGEDDARALGVNTERLKAVIIISATVLTAGAVCISGIIGWIGLVIPHIGRLISGPDHRTLVPVSMLLGAAYLVGVDTAARTLLVTEIPIGILTAMIGAPIFAFLLRRNGTGW